MNNSLTSKRGGPRRTKRRPAPAAEMSHRAEPVEQARRCAVESDRKPSRRHVEAGTVTATGWQGAVSHTYDTAKVPAVRAQGRRAGEAGVVDALMARGSVRSGSCSDRHRANLLHKRGSRDHLGLVVGVAIHGAERDKAPRSHHEGKMFDFWRLKAACQNRVHLDLRAGGRLRSWADPPRDDRCSSGRRPDGRCGNRGAGA